ncbi:hypothetical protein RHGRI_006392 [Rhododendron griersonianum]|uniref:Uncharacterized protein n=1 Tax=Rhododendron griersonianum TaxID=479676 RepID=A0AAV6KUE6_9ERIC|nr:hypothetical protein RHGRI_006392 [Rhododendron griersonianum]
MQGNSFGGNIPPLSGLKNIQFLDLSHNHLSGQIPQYLAMLSSLLSLNLSFNNLEGEVPVEGVFRSPSAIHVSGNKKLCGGIQELKLQPCPIQSPEKPKKSASLTLILVLTIVASWLALMVLPAHRTKKLNLEVSPHRAELGGALADLLNENRKGYGDNEMGYVERTLGFRTWILDDRDLRLLSDGHLSPGITLEPRCGPAPVKLVTPEKHRNFVKGVLENRHGKASSKESSATDMDPEVLESSPRMQRKRKREEPSIPSEEDSTVESRFREQGMKLVK